MNKKITEENVWIREDIDCEIEEERGPNSKVYQLKGGKKLMTISNEPQHYKDKKDGKFKEFSNDLKSEAGGLCGTRGECRVVLPDGVNNTGTVKISCENCGVEWEYIGDGRKRTIAGKLVKVKMSAPDVRYDHFNTVHMKKSDSEKYGKYPIARYVNVSDKVDLEYEIKNNAVKENIIINEPADSYEFCFSMKTPGLIPIADDKRKTIEFYERLAEDECGDKRFEIPAPFMSDAEGRISGDVSYKLDESGDGEFKLWIIADEKWINDAERAFPVVVDPYIYYYDYTFLSVNSYPNTIFAGFEGSNSMGSTLTVSVGSFFKKYKIHSADLILTPSRGGSDAPFDLLYKIDDHEYPLYPTSEYTVGGNVTSWVRDANDSSSQGTFDIQLLAKIKCPECRNNEEALRRFSGYIEFSNVNVRVVYYEEEYYENNQSFVGDSLVGNVNLSTGKLYYKQEDCHTGSTAIPFSLYHCYNVDKKDTESTCGSGWNLSVNQSIKWLGGRTILANYTDGQGTVHYFTMIDGYLQDMGGLNMRLSRGSDGYTIITDNGETLKFNSDGYLTEIKNASENKVFISRNYSGNVFRISDSFGRNINLYYTAGKLSKITDPSGRAVSYTYDPSGLLAQVNYPDDSSIEYTYVNRRLAKAKNRDNTITLYEYCSENSNNCKIASIKKYAAGSNTSSDNPEEYLDIEYRIGNSTAVSDRSGIRKVYVFDNNGRPELIYEDRPMIIDGEKVSDRFQVTGTTIYKYNDTKRTFSASLRTCDDKNNLITNGSFESGEASWQFIGDRMPNCNMCESDGVINTDSSDKHKAFMLTGQKLQQKYIKQTIPAHKISLDFGDTLVLSAWAKANSALIPPNDTEDLLDDEYPKFSLRAEVCYTDGTIDNKYIRSYDCYYRNWQYAALPIRIDKNKELSCINVILDYSYNNGTCLFDNVRLVNAPSQSVTYDKRYSSSNYGELTVFGTKKYICERTTAYDGIYKLVEEKDSKFNVIRRTLTDQDGKLFESVFEYDNNDRVIRSQNERKIITEYTYNSVGMQTCVKSYYWEEFNPNFNTGVIHPTEYFKSETSYDSTGEFAVGVSDQRSEDIKTQNSYETTKGLLNSTTTPNGQVTNCTYDSNSDLVTSVSTMIGSTEYSVLYGYTNNKLTSITHNGFDYGFTYDGIGRSKKVTIAGADYAENSYTLTDTTTVSTTYAGGEVMTVETDRKDQPVKRTYTDKLGVTTVIAEGEYDTLGKPVKVIDKITNKEYTYVYDGYENVTEEKINGSLFKEYSYDSHNRLESTNICLSGGTQTYRPIYDKRASDNAIYSDNAVVGITLDGVFTEKAERDEYGRVSEKKLTLGTAVSPLIKDTYSYLDTQFGFAKRLTTMVGEITRTVGGEVRDSLKYTYDNNGNITEIKNGDELLAKYEYDGQNQLIREDNAVFAKTYTFAYDAGGNITSKKIYQFAAGELGALIDTKTYSYSSTGWKDRLTSYSGETITYDALGNPTTYRGHSLTWARIRNLTSYDTLTFDYDAGGNRTRKGNITYTLDGSKILAETRPTGTIKYFYGTSGVAGFEYNNAKYFYLKNAQGDITAIYDETGNLKAEYEYDAWGNHVITVDADGIGTLNPFRYRGYYYDDETGLYYLQSRYYDPEVGRFISADENISQVGNIVGNNLFVYSFNNPIVYVDNDGRWPSLSQIFVAVAVAAVVVCAVALCVVTAGTSLVVVAGVGTTLYMTAAAVSAFEVACAAFSIAVASMATVAVIEAVEKAYYSFSREYTVYFLIDPKTHYVEYVGRTKNVAARRYAHSINPDRAHLNFRIAFTNLNIYEARGLEHILIIYLCTINKYNPMNNQINGISDSNPNLPLYLAAAKFFLQHLNNRISNELLNLLEQQ